MTEALLHYIWEFQYFDKTDLQTTEGESITIVHQGFKHTHSGPDFLNGKVRIGELNWIGNIEIHIDASSWIDHRHDKDQAYDNVILHVVWNEDKPILRRDGTRLPTLELKHRVRDTLLLQYRKLINNPDQIPCAEHFPNVSMITKFSMIDKALLQRLEGRSALVMAQLEKCQQDWEEVTYRLLCRNFGFKVNNEPFEQLARSLPYRLILKHSDQLLQVEALLFGQAGFLEEKSPDGYMSLLQREYAVLSAKYSLADGKLNKSQWKFLRLRPANFPTIRIAQLAGLLSTQKNIFSRMIEAQHHKALLNVFSNATSPYWKHHYQFLKPQENTVPELGPHSVANIIVNTTVPMLVAYGKAKDDQRMVDRAIDILQHIDAEENKIIKLWSSLGVRSKSAADSQGLIELYNGYCIKRRCLDCNIGFSLLQSS
jgi:hypothetical protein